MKKTAAYILGFTLIASQLAPGVAAASEPNVVDYKTNEEIVTHLQEKLSYEIKKVSENVHQIDVKIGEEETVAIFNKEKGTVSIDGKVVSTIEVISEESFDGSKTEIDPEISLLSSYPEYNIFKSNGSGVWNINKHSNTRISFGKEATVAAIVATLIGQFLNDKPSKDAAALITAATSLYALFAETLAFNVQFKGKSDKYDRYEKQDTIYVYKGTSDGLFKINYN